MSLPVSSCIALCAVCVQEVMMTLDACHRDFLALIHRIELERQLEKYPHQRSEYTHCFLHG